MATTVGQVRPDSSPCQAQPDLRVSGRPRPGSDDGRPRRTQPDFIDRLPGLTVNVDFEPLEDQIARDRPADERPLSRLLMPDRLLRPVDADERLIRMRGTRRDLAD